MSENNEANEQADSAAEEAKSNETPETKTENGSAPADEVQATSYVSPKDLRSARVAALAEDYQAQEVNIKSLLDAGAHFGHKTEKWCPKMLPYIFTQRSGVHIINLDMTLEYWERARKFIVDVASRGGSVLFVGTKLQAKEIVKNGGLRSGSFYVSNRWLGGTLSNFETIKKSISRMNKLEDLLAKADDDDSDVRLGKKEKLSITRQLEKLDNNLGGIRDMKRLPDVLFIVDIKKESIAVSEARKLHIPVVALVDTNVAPEKINFPIPSNDDASRTISLFVDGVADAVIEGKAAYASRMEEIAVERKRRETSKADKAAQKKDDAAANDATPVAGAAG